ncbi:uncharacterized protein LOC135169883 [Diachasmimorpha longicaudata]|uniref:uncharacterized protein LOC135169883 n=1 Tax=Diachasmimorpha longicaudata TaxID=58733 RepID=UPI0030B885D6
MARESVWKRTKAYFRRMRGKKVGGWIALLLLLMSGQECSAYVNSEHPLANDIDQFDHVREDEPLLTAWELPVNSEDQKIMEMLGEALHTRVDIDIEPEQINIATMSDSREVRRQFIEGDGGRVVMESPPKWREATDFTAIMCTTGIASLG